MFQEGTDPMTFNTSLKFGQIGESIFHQAYVGIIDKHPGDDGDFFDVMTGEKLELKSDYYPMTTGNFFFERYSDFDKKSPGGPWQALEHGCTTFCYLYLKDLTVFRFNTAELVATLEPLLEGLKPSAIKNKSYTTVGYRVPRELLRDIMTEEKLSVRRQADERSESGG